MGIQNLDKDLVSTLSEEERAAIAGDDSDAAPADADDDAAALKAVADGAADDEGDDDDDAPADPALEDPADAQPAAAAPAQAPAAADAAPAAAPAAAEVEADDDEPAQAAAAPSYRYELPADFAERKEALKTAREELRVRRKEGDISNDEYDVEYDRLSDEQRELDRIESRHDIAVDMQRHQEQERNTSAANRVMQSAKKAGLDYESDQEAFAELRGTIGALQQIESHRSKGFEHVLREANRRVLLARGIAEPKAAPAPAQPVTPAAAEKAAADARKPDLAATPKTLAQVPGGDGPGDVGGEFEDIMSLEGEEYEDAIAQLAKNPQRWRRFQASMQ